MSKKRIGAVACLAALSAACGSDAGSGGGSSARTGDPVTLSASLDAGYTVAAAPGIVERLLAVVLGKPVIAAGERVNQAWGVPIYRSAGEVYGDFTRAVKTDVDTQGRFSLALDDANDWIVLLMDTTQAQKKNQVVGYVSATDVAERLSMLLMPLSDAATDSLDIGELTQVDDEARSSTSLEAQQTNYSIGIERLLELASVDDTFKAIRNRYVNSDESSGDYYFLRLGFHWQTPLAEVTDRYSEHTLMDSTSGRYKGYTVEAETNRAPPDGVCATDAGARVAVEIFPPADVTHSALGYTYNATTPLANDERAQAIGDYDAISCYDEDINIAHRSANGEPYRFGGPWGLDYLAGAVPPGEWSFRIDGTEVASFDVASGYPFDTLGFPNVYFPSVRVSTGDNDEITAIDVRWYHYDPSANAGAGGYVEVTDTSIFAQLTGSHFIGMIDYSGTSGGRIEENHYRESGIATGVSSADFDTPGWQLGGNDASTLALDELSVGYRMGDTSYRFAFRD